MARTLTVAPAALRDLADIATWLAQPGAGRRARARRQALDKAVNDLARRPCSYPLGDHQGVRERPVAGYRLLYQVTPDTGSNETAGGVEILRILGPGQDHSRF